MKKLFVIVAVMAAASSCLSVSVNGKDWHIGGLSKPIEAGETVEQVREIPTVYTGLSTNGSIDIIISPDVKPGTVVVRAGKNVIDRLGTEVRGGRLNVGWEGNISIRNSGGTQVFVPMSAYTNISISGSGDITLPASFKTAELDIRTSGSGDVKGFAEVAEGVNISISGSGDVTLAGSCGGKFTVRKSGSSDIDCANFVCRNASLSSSGSGDIRITATESIGASTSGSGDIYYSGSARLTHASASGSGKIRQF